MVDAAAIYLMGATLAALLGFAWLALAMEVHWRQVFGRVGPSPGTRSALRLLGGASLLGSLGLCLLADHASMAALVWFMLLALAGVCVALLLAWRSAWLRRLWPG
ncbi:hypothetical protein CKO35_12065 [Ectothiorhodospira shaposhnikovii]|uniref:DUF3325 domain-containing protein n=1 Tax=Ectothiorhodospira shaposhnikovii TaxID=1054 RepID=UPI001903B001|nr:DUF3325 domain-containing protein [Ectothiorhodospira shaposhnikovii]MBK1674030.1 hypothetical protein [Ectothiorhodospira shaposhnikovii]